MKIPNGKLAGGVARLLLASLGLFACLILFTESAQAQRPAPTPINITDREPAGEPERVELEGGKYRLVYRNKAGQVIKEEEYAVGVLVSIKNIDSYYPNGQEASVSTEYFDPVPVKDLGATRVEFISYDEFGRPQERLIRDLTQGWQLREHRREKWNRRAQRWEPAPEREFWNPKTGKWEQVPEIFRFNPKFGDWERVTPSATPTPSDSSDNRAAPVTDSARATLEAVDGIKRGTSASPGYQAANTVATGLSTATFTTPQGTIYVNLPSDMAAGDTLSGTVVAEPKSQDPKQQTKNQRDLSEYVVELGQQRIAISAGGMLRLALPTAISTTSYLILRDKKGKEVCRSEVPVASSLPTIGEFTLPTLGQQGRPIEFLGSFDGNLDTTRVRVGGQDVQLLAESPRRMIARNTSPRAGLTEIELREGDQVRRGPFRSLGISLSAPKLNLLRGEGTTLTIVVTGLEDLRESIPLVIENRSPGVISMGGGNLQPVMIAPGDVRQGSYTTERPLTGIQPGGFTITATVTRRGEEDQSQTPPNVTARPDSGAGPQTAAGQTPGYNICGSGCGTYATEQGTGRIRCVTTSTCKGRGTNCKCHLFRRPRNTNQDYEHVDGPNAWTDPEGGFEYVCRCVN